MEKLTSWVRGIFDLLYDICVEWFKLTTTVFLVLSFPLFIYILYDFLTADISLAFHLMIAISRWLSDNPALSLIILSVILYVTYIQLIDLRKEREEERRRENRNEGSAI